MPSGEAKSLLEKRSRHAAAAGGPVVVEHDPQADLVALQQLAEAALQELSPHVALEPLEPQPWAEQTLHQPQSLLLDVTGIGKLFGDEATLARRALQMAARRDLTARVAIAHSPGAAWAIAHYGTSDGGSRVVEPGQEGSALWPLPVAALRLPIEAAHHLRRLGIETVGDLLRLPRAGLATRLGAAVLRRIDQALGTLHEPLPVHHPPPSDRVQTELEYATSDQRILSHRIGLLVQQLAAGLAQRQRGALRLTCRLEMEQHRPLDLQLGLFQPSADADHLTRLLLGIFERRIRPLPALVHHIVVAATHSGPLAQRQADLWSEGAGSGTLQMTQLARLIDGISGRVGPNRVCSVAPSASQLPEQAYHLRPLAGGRRPAANRRRSARTSENDQPFLQPSGSPTAAAPSPDDPLRRPIELLPQPIPIERVELDAGGIPLHFRLPGQPQPCQVIRHWGPERIETGWWRGPSVRRDYFRIETDCGQWLWIFRQLSDDAWMLHGWFG